MTITSTTASDDTIEAFVDWLDKTRRRTPATLSTYRRTAESLACHAHPSHVLDLTLPELERFLLRPRRRVQGPSAATQRLETAVIRSLFKWAGSRGMLRQEDPTVLLSEQAPTVRNEKPKPVPMAAWKAVWGSDLSDSERVALGLGYFCGLRRSEIMGITDGQVDLERRVIERVLRKGGKRMDVRYGSALDLHVARLPELLVDPEWLLGPLVRRVRALGAHGGHLVGFGGTSAERRPQALNRRLTVICQRVGVDSFSPHQMRHSFVTNLLAVGIPMHVASRLAAHASLQVTMRYVDTGEDPLAAFLD